MAEMIAFCGGICTKCPAFLATRNDDNEERRKTAELWSKKYDADIKPEQINCDGCQSNSGAFFYCNICEIRKCGREKGVKNCAYCDDFICEELGKFFAMAPEGKATLDRIREGL